MLEPLMHEIRRKSIVLASASPRRSDILSGLGIAFEVFPSTFDEKDLNPSDFQDNREFCRQLAYRKGHQIASEVLRYKENVDLIISADTIVEYDGRVFGKPLDDADADKMLTLLSGKKHRVISAVCIITCSRGQITDSVVFHEETDVFMADLSPETVRCYVASGEPLGKAGAYAIQGLGASLVSRIEGDYYTVVGLPVHKLCRYLKQIIGDERLTGPSQ